MATLLNVDGQIWLLLGKLLYKSSPVSQSFSDLHAYLTLGLLCVIELTTVQHEFLILEKHRDF